MKKTILILFGGFVGLVVLLIGIALILGANTPVAHEATTSIQVDRPPQTVWDVLMDVPRHPEWRSQLQEVETEIDGQRYILTIQGSSVKFTLDVAEAEAPRRVVWRTQDVGGPMNVRWEILLEPQDEGTRVTINEQGTTEHAWFRFVLRYLIGYETFSNAFLQDLRAHAMNK